MKINQLSFFLENEPGHLARLCRVLAGAGVNIITLSLADTAQFGILRLIVDDWRKAKTAIEARGCTVKVAEVIATQVEDRPGGLADVLDEFDHGVRGGAQALDEALHRDSYFVLSRHFRRAFHARRETAPICLP